MISEYGRAKLLLACRLIAAFLSLMMVVHWVLCIGVLWEIMHRTDPGRYEGFMVFPGVGFLSGLSAISLVVIVRFYRARLRRWEKTVYIAAAAFGFLLFAAAMSMNLWWMSI